jgi:hypothetical protein
MKIWCLELRLQPLSELLIRQVGKSNVQWFSYPFLPPTAFSGFVASLLAGEGDKNWRKNYIELNDDQAREVGALFSGVFSVGAYPDPPALVRRNRHYRQHLGDVYNYEASAWAGNKKLAIAESCWTPELRGFLLAETEESLQRLSPHSNLRFRIMRVGKKSVVKVESVNGPWELDLQQVQGIVPSTVAPLEMIRQFPRDLEVLYVPMRMRKQAGNKLVRETYPCVFGQPIYGEVYVHDTVIIPKPLVGLAQPRIG